MGDGGSIMRRLRILASALVVALVAALALPAAADVPLPAVAKAKGGQCVDSPESMRRNHMDMLKHQRDTTMRQGVRTPQFSLKGCLDCHAVAGADGKPVGTDNPQHFCRSCHSYAGVKPDCFECHNDKPAKR